MLSTNSIVEVIWSQYSFEGNNLQGQTCIPPRIRKVSKQTAEIPSRKAEIEAWQLFSLYRWEVINESHTKQWHQYHMGLGFHFGSIIYQLCDFKLNCNLYNFFKFLRWYMSNSFVNVLKWMYYTNHKVLNILLIFKYLVKLVMIVQMLHVLKKIKTNLHVGEQNMEN